jgi:uncharacterized protein involved in outer membrane biogenesis
VPKKILIGGLIAFVLLFAGTFLWARSVLTGENVRAALAARVEKAIGQPVSIGTISATILPRVTMTLGDVKIGRPERIRAGELHIGTDLRALLSRRMEHASLKLTGARIELPLPDFTIAASTKPPAGTGPGTAPVELVSIDEIVLSDVQVVSGGRTLRGDIEVVPQGKGLLIRKVALVADQTTINVTGRITDFMGPVGELQVKAGALNMDQLLAFVNDFTTGTGRSGTSAGPGQGRASASAADAKMNIALSLETESAAMNGLTLSKLNGQAHVAGHGLTLAPVSFGIFGGQYQGSLTLTPVKDTLHFRGSSTLSRIDVAAATAFGGTPGAISGRLSGRFDFTGSGTDAAAVMKSVRGKARVDIVDGVVKNLGLINSVVAATSMRPGSLGQVASSAQSGQSDEPFSRLGATLEIGNGSVSTTDLIFEAKDVTLNAQGVIGLVSSTIDLKGKIQLSDALSQQAGRDLVRYTQERDRVTLAATVTGPIEAPSVRIAAGDMARRALQNAADEQKERVKQEATKALSKKLGGLLGR